MISILPLVNYKARHQMVHECQVIYLTLTDRKTIPVKCPVWLGSLQLSLIILATVNVVISAGG